MKRIREILAEKFYLNEAVKKTGKPLDFFWNRIKDEIYKIRIVLNDDETAAAYFEKILYAMIDSYLQGAEGYLPAASLPGQMTASHNDTEEILEFLRCPKCGDELISTDKTNMRYIHANIRNCKPVFDESPVLLLREIAYAWQSKAKENEKEIYSLELELDGVMFLAVDKWLDGNELKQDNTQRAAAAREVALKAIEKAQAERDELKRRFNVQ